MVRVNETEVSRAIVGLACIFRRRGGSAGSTMMTCSSETCAPIRVSSVRRQSCTRRRGRSSEPSTCTRTSGCSSTQRYNILYVSLRLRVQNRRKKWNFPLNFQTMRKLSDLYSGIFQTQSSGCASGVNYFTNFTKLKNLNF